MQPMAKRGSSWVVVASLLIGSWEGMSLVAYPDRLAHDLPTVCAGATKSELPGLKVGDRFTHDQCDQILVKALPVYDAGIHKCIHVPMNGAREGMVVSLAYNIGVGAVCKSTFVRHLNSGDPDACKYMLVFNTARGHYVQGLANRRSDEYRYCVQTNWVAEVIAPPPPPPAPPSLMQRSKRYF